MKYVLDVYICRLYVMDECLDKIYTRNNVLVVVHVVILSHYKVKQQSIIFSA